MRRARRIAFIVLLVLILASVIASLVALRRVDPAQLGAAIRATGPLWPAALFLATAAMTSLGLPLIIPLVIAALSLGFAPAVAIVVLSSTIGACVAFQIARALGKGYVEERFVRRLRRLEELDRRLERNGLLTILALRLMMPIPFELVNIIGALSRIRFADYAIATLIGLVPGVAVTVFFVRSLGTPWSPGFFAASLGMAALSLLPLLSKKVRGLAF